MNWPDLKASYVDFDDAAALAIASASPESFLSGYTGKLILDEIQLLPELYRALKSSIDTGRMQGEGKLSGLYIPTGSTDILALPKLSDALVGRMIIKTLYPLSGSEVHESKGGSLGRLRAGNFAAGSVRKYDVVATIQKATFPEFRDASVTAPADWFRSYISTLIQRDVQHIMNIEKTTLLPQLLRLLATRVGGILNEADTQGKERSLGVVSISRERFGRRGLRSGGWGRCFFASEGGQERAAD
jgi:predicted AAA+ superfamily ATPase